MSHTVVTTRMFLICFCFVAIYVMCYCVFSILSLVDKDLFPQTVARKLFWLHCEIQRLLLRRVRLYGRTLTCLHVHVNKSRIVSVDSFLRTTRYVVQWFNTITEAWLWTHQTIMHSSYIEMAQRKIVQPMMMVRIFPTRSYSDFVICSCVWN